MNNEEGEMELYRVVAIDGRTGPYTHYERDEQAEFYAAIGFAAYEAARAGCDAKTLVHDLRGHVDELVREDAPPHEATCHYAAAILERMAEAIEAREAKK